MNAKASILIVDSNESFATMLRESLEQAGAYRATATSTGEQAIEALAGLDVQGTLPKPFFLPDLPGRINEALRGSVSGAPDVAETAEPDRGAGEPVASAAGSLRVPQESMPQVVEELTRLCQEINAEAVILTGGERLLARAGQLGDEEIDALAEVVAESWRTSARVAQILGTEQLRFEQSVEGGEHVLYSLAVAEDIILSAALRASAPLGIIRHQAKSTAGVVRDCIKPAS